MRLKPLFRYAIYAAFAVLFLTGAGWLLADWHKESGEEIWQQASANLLMVHGGVAMLALMLLGALIPVHLLRAWRSGKNRVSGSIMAALNAALILSAFGLYYLGSESMRPFISWSHIAAGVVVSLSLPIHVILGNRSRRQ